METTGILMLGKMSVGVRTIMTGAAIRMSSASTMKVYGRLRATLTIHIERWTPSNTESAGTTPTFYIDSDASQMSHSYFRAFVSERPIGVLWSFVIYAILLPLRSWEASARRRGHCIFRSLRSASRLAIWNMRLGLTYYSGWDEALRRLPPERFFYVRRRPFCRQRSGQWRWRRARRMATLGR